MKTALIIGGGDIDPLLISRVHSRSNLLICADHGADSALEAGLVPDLIVGDLDSIHERTLRHFRGHGVEINQDDDTDLLDTEIAILKAIEAGVDRMIIMGAWGDRIDQSLPVFGFLTPESIPQSTLRKIPMSFTGDVYVVTDHCIISRASPGTTTRIPSSQTTRVGLIPLPRAENLHTVGLRYELTGTDLTFSRTMSVSNIPTGTWFDITFDSGDLAVIQWVQDPETLEGRIRELTGRQKELDADQDYYTLIREIYDHGGIGPTDPEGKAHRLKLTRTFLDTLVPDHTSLRVIHIAGTSGKGSTALFLHSILTASNERPTGILTSPHIHDPNERILVDHDPIPHREVVRIWRELLPGIRTLEAQHNVLFLYQELLLLIGLRYFIDSRVEWAVIETGLGGRFDQTRALEADVTAITQIDLDHTHILGSTIQDIAREKAGIIRETVSLHTAETDTGALRVFEEVCERQNADIIRCIPELLPDMGPGRFSLGPHEFVISQPGDHQMINAALAASIATDPKLTISPDVIRTALLRTRLPGRIEVRGDLIIDTGHNPREIRTLSRTLSEILPEGTHRIVICGMAETKDHAGMLESVATMADAVILTKSGYRGMDPRNLLRITRTLPEFDRVGSVLTEPDAVRAFTVGRALQREYGDGCGSSSHNSVIIVTGSTFLVDEIFNPDPELRKINSS